MRLVLQVGGIYLVGCFTLGLIAVVPTPSWLERRRIEKSLRGLAHERRRIRSKCEQAEQDFRRHAAGAGESLAALTLILVDLDQCCDMLLDELDAVS